MNVGFPSGRCNALLLLVLAARLALPSVLSGQGTGAPADAKALNQAGASYLLKADYRGAIDSYNQALAQARSANDAQQQAAALNGIGNCYRIQNENQKALDSYNQALDLAASSGDERGQAAALIGIGWVNDNGGQSQKALDFHNRALLLARKVQDADLEAIALRRTGADYAGLGQMQHALEYLAQALTVDRQAGDRIEEGLTLNLTGFLYGNLGHKEKALECFNQALPIFRQAGYPVGEAVALSDIGLADAALGQYEKALDYDSQALAIYRQIGDRAGQAEVLSAIGVVYVALNNPRKALETFNQVLPIYRETGDRQGEANALKQIGLAYDAIGDKQKAMDSLNQALPVLRQAGDLDGEAMVLGAIGNCYNDLGDKQKALDFYSQASTAYRRKGDLDGQARVLYNIGNLRKDLGNYAAAEDYYNQALPFFRQAGDRQNLATTLHSLSVASSHLGENAKVLEYESQALEIFRQLGDRKNEADVLSNSSVAYNRLRQEQKALDYGNQALAIYRQLGDRKGQATALGNMGIDYCDLGEWQRALDYDSQALEIFRQLGDLSGQASVLNDFGMDYENLGDMSKALDYYNQALPFLRQTGERAQEANTLGNIGSTYAELGDNAKALDYFNQALPVLEQLGDRLDEANTLANIGIVYSRLRESQKALDHYDRALPLATAVSDPFLEANINLDLMRLQQSAQPALAIFFGKQAVNYLQQVRGNMQGLEKGMQSRFLDSRRNYYLELADLLIGQGRLPEAQQVLDFMKQQEYSDYVRGDPTNTLSPLALTPAEQQAQQDYQKSTAQLVSLGEEWAQLKKNAARTPDQETRYQQLSDQLSNASKGLNEYYARLYVLFGNNGDANKQVADVKGNVSLFKQTIAKMPHTVALYTMVTSEGYKVIVITGAAMVEREYAIPEKDLNQAVAAFGQVLRHPSGDPKPLAQQLYKILIGPVKADLDQAQAQTLVWSLDGALRYLPMAALYDGRQYLVENYSTVTITPASIPHLSDKPDVSSLSTVAMGISRKYEGGLPPLPSVVGELDDIVSDAKVEGAHGVLPGTILLDGQFTKKAMENQLESPHGVVHIASHFVFKPGDDSQSYLLLSGEEEAGAGFHLTVADFRDNQKLALDNTELLTLSACETGMGGDAGNGREVDGLGTTAQLKGAKAVISSLWEVNDSSTGELMADFYQRWVSGAGKVAKVEALRQAQLDLLLGKAKPKSGSEGRGLETGAPAEDVPEGYAHPYYWAPFVLMGNWN